MPRRGGAHRSRVGSRGHQGALAATDQAPAATTGTVETLDLLDAFADHVRSFIDVSPLAPLKVVADTANGMGGLVVPAVFAGLPVELDHPLSRARRHLPQPSRPIRSIADNLVDLCARVLEVGADIGLAFDGDADRVFLVDEKAQPVSGSLTTAMVAAGMLDANPGSTVIHNLICSKTVPEVIAERGGTAVRSRVGHSFIKGLMAETDAIFAGEHSGHYYFRDNYRADSGLIAALVVLEQLSKAGVTLSELRKPFERYVASGEINTVVDDQQAVIERIAAAHADADARPPRRAHRRSRRLVVQRATRRTPNRCCGSTSRLPTPATMERRVAESPGADGGRRALVIRCPWRSINDCSTSWSAPRTRVPWCTAKTTHCCTTRGCGASIGSSTTSRSC